MNYERIGELIEALKKRRWRLATAESCTGGMLGASITAVAGASDAYLGGWIAYANQMKVAELRVPRSLLEPGGPGAVSREIAEAMASGGAAASGAEVCISVTGIAGPGGGTAEKPVGTVWLGLAMPDGVRSRLLRLDGDREAIRVATVEAAIGWLEESLRERP